MEESYASKYRELEEDHWWFFGRRNIIYNLIKNYCRDAEILEVGCSGGILIEFLKGQGFKRLQGIDIDEKAVEICRRKGIANVYIADAKETGFKDQQFDIIIASDVLEHIKDQDKALLEWRRILKPNGKLIIFVPAFKFLWSGHDEANQHYRRYTKSELTNILEENGFKVERGSHWNLSLFFPISLVRLSKRLFLSTAKKHRDQLQGVNLVINKMLEYILRLENKLLSEGEINFPVGMSVFAIARKT